MKLSLYYPVSPHIVNQGWGIPNNIYLPFGFSRHNGIDLALQNGQPIHAPFDCEVVKIGNQPEGGGIFVGVLSTEQYQWNDQKLTYVLLDFLHCKEIKVKEGQILKAGDLVALGDNTGFSTGSHTHLQPRRVDRYLNNLDSNDANNSFDPTPYFNGLYAIDIPRKKLIGLLQKLVDLYKQLIKK